MMVRKKKQQETQTSVVYYTRQDIETKSTKNILLLTFAFRKPNWDDVLFPISLQHSSSNSTNSTLLGSNPKVANDERSRGAHSPISESRCEGRHTTMSCEESSRETSVDLYQCRFVPNWIYLTKKYTKKNYFVKRTIIQTICKK